MLDQYAPPQSWRSLALAGIICGLLLAAFWSLSTVVKWIGAPFLYLPSQLGLAQLVQPEEVQTFHLGVVPTQPITLQPGRYSVFTGDLKLLEKSRRGIAWLSVKTESGERLKVDVVDRGLRPYDTHLAAGRPVFQFVVTEPGTYTLAYTLEHASMNVLPDYTSGNETTIVAAYLLQIGIITSVVAAYMWQQRRRVRRRWADKDAAFDERSARADAFWKAQAAQRQQHTDK